MFIYPTTFFGGEANPLMDFGWTIRKLMGCWDFFSLQGFFFSQLLSLQVFFWGSKSPDGFFFVRGGGGELEEEYSTVAILVLTLTTIWMPGTGSKFNQIIFNFHSCFPSFPAKIILGGTWPNIRHIQVLLPELGLHCFFGFMFREISISFIHYPCNKIHFWHAVNQVWS